MTFVAWHHLCASVIVPGLFSLHLVSPQPVHKVAAGTGSGVDALNYLHLTGSECAVGTCWELL